jgi:uncharacterized protein YecE (DUF72 family)
MRPRVGCCGWAGAQSDYFTRFPAVEIQSTFYDPPSLKVAMRWRSIAPPDFHFCIKAWQLITHTPASPTYRRLRAPVRSDERDLLGSFRDTEPVCRAWERTREIATVLDARLVVFQCPASFLPSAANIGNFSKFFLRLGAQPFQLAWEPRGAWPPELVYELCVEHGLIHCVDPFLNQSVHGDALYWRLHGKGSYSYRYTDADLEELRRMFSRQKEGRQAYILFNNLAMKDDAGRFQQMIFGNDMSALDRDV